MPELAEVEYFRKRWDCGLGKRIVAVKLHPGKRIFRGIDIKRFERALRGSILRSSAARGKQMLFRFSNDVWLGLHLGMTGHLSVVRPDFAMGKHDHLALYQKNCALVFSDMRLFGRVLFHQGPAAPDWWAKLPPDLRSRSFTISILRAFLERHRKLPIKAALLLQAGFPGVGNWMADEILWRSKLHPRTLSGEIGAPKQAKLWRQIRSVCRKALENAAQDLFDPPSGWLFHERWKRDGVCPLHKIPLLRERIGGRTTAWCPSCQKARK